MDAVKATINIKEGIISLEGPEGFVEKYLDEFKNILQQPKGVTGSTEQAKGERQEKPAQTSVKKPRISKAKVGPSAGERVRELFDEGFFKDPKSIEDIVSHLKDQKGTTYPSNVVSATMSNIMKSPARVLRRIKEGKGYKYTNI